jgi:hypothetical protein
VNREAKRYFGPLIPNLAFSLGLAASAVTAHERAHDTVGTRLRGVTRGAYAVGFEVRTGIDHSRAVNLSDPGAAIGLAIWYPAQATQSARDAMTAIDYRLLDLQRDPSEAEKRRYQSTAWKTVSPAGR